LFILKVKKMNENYKFFEYQSGSDTYIVNVEDIRYLRSNGVNQTRIYFSDGDQITCPFPIGKIREIIKKFTGYIEKLQ